MPIKKLLGIIGLGCLAMLLLWKVVFAGSYGEPLGERFVQISSSAPGATASYHLGFEIPSSGTVGSVRITFCSNSPLPDTACVAPTGMDASAATLDTQSGTTGFSIGSGTNANTLVLTRTAASASGLADYVFSNIVNPSAVGSYYGRLELFASQDATGAIGDYGATAFAIANLVSITATVPPYLIFCTGITIPGNNCQNATGDFVDFGELSTSRARTGTSQLLVATNADGGYGITVLGGPLTSGANVIPALSNGDVSRPGTSQFGFNLRSNVAPAVGSEPSGPGVGQPQTAYGQPNTYRLASGESIVVSNKPDDKRLFTASYIANITSTQPAGIYVTTLTYVCLALF